MDPRFQQVLYTSVVKGQRNKAVTILLCYECVDLFEITLHNSLIRIVRSCYQLASNLLTTFDKAMIRKKLVIITNFFQTCNKL